MIRVVVIERSIPHRDALVRALEAEGDIRVVGQAGRARDAIEVVAAERPEVVTLDVDLQGGGKHVIEQIMAFNPTPILVLSQSMTEPDSEAVVDALVAGAVDALPMPDQWDTTSARALRDRIRILRGVAVVRHVRGRLGPRRTNSRGGAELTTATPVVAIGASTGGPAALATVLSGLTGVEASILVVQHLHPDFIESFVDWMTRVSAVPVELARHRAPLQPGVAYIAPGGAHLKVGMTDRIVLDPEPQTLHRPSVDVLFSSLACRPRGKKVGVLLTGIGDDGAAGLLDLRKNGGITMAQDETSSAVYGMPAAAEHAGAVGRLLPLESIAPEILRVVS